MEFLLLTVFLFWINFASCEVFYQETFSDDGWEKRWVQSSWKDDMGKFELSHGNKWYVDKKIETGLMTPNDAKFYAISSKLNKPFSNKNQNLVVQFSVKNTDRENGFCAGGYIKLLPATVDQATFGGDSPYYIMFGPDICGYDVSRIHLIFNYKGENLLKKTDIKLDYEDKDDKTHLYTLVLKPDNTYTVYMDQKEKSHGSLLDDWDFPQKTRPDPTDVKPSNWVDEEYIEDPESVKPDGWDDVPKMIPDPEAIIPEDWDEEDDGVWEPPMISNPEWKGEWKPKKIKNPAYNGPWIQKTVQNPDYDENIYSYEDIGAVGFELWVVNSGSIFDNIYVGNSQEEADKLAAETWNIISPKEEDVKQKYKDAQEKKKSEESEDDVDDLDNPQEKEEL